MEPAKPAISQKEYLKRYLMKDKKSKVKKKKSNISSSTHLKRSVIIDDDINIDEIPRVVNDTFSLDHLGDEAPQIAGIVDERPEEVKLEEKYKSGEWKPLKPDDRSDVEDRMPDFSNKHSRQAQEDDLSPPRRTDLKKDRDNSQFKGKPDKVQSYRERSSGGSDVSDLSPRRNRRREELETRGGHEDGRKTKDGRRGTREERNVDSDLSPPRSRRRDEKSSRSAGVGEDKKERPKNSDSRSSRREGQSDDSDLSPPRHSRWSDDLGRKDGKKYKTGSGEDRLKSKSRDNKSSRRPEKSDDSDLSPPRKNARKGGFERQGAKGKDEWADRRRKRASDGCDSDLDVPRKNPNDRDKKRGSSKRERSSPVQRSNKSDEDSDLSPPRKDRSRNTDNSTSRKRGRNGRGGSDSDLSPPRNRGGHGSDLSPPRKSRGVKDNDDKRNRKEKLDHMQDGKRAGLQDAKSLKDELRILKENEDEVFRRMDPELLGRSTAAVVRDRKTGLKRDLEKERQIEREKSAKNAVRQQKYAKWGKGLKQVRDQEEKVADMVHEMSKPLARYANDDDLERALKAQEREGDPMLEYIKRHQKESHSIDLTDGGIRKKYVGSYLPNRFNIAPGHRWDGVDRSNGYEQKWFEAKNAKKATSEEAWKWSSADM